MSEQKAASPPPSVAWHVSNHSANGSGQCVEAGPYRDNPTRFAIRDSQHRTQATLTVPGAEWTAFLDGVRSGEF
ncbi:DUF397 domain-containing protein [Lipingzhangella halophila]|uniref:DUF397 domain-containing protein n=1 Tax=Lipingzhangella halophila TaxID=1783352 RepID=UPI00160BA1C5|nr:DUF397 domain-containing protein [Lipingzhangella halophila]